MAYSTFTSIIPLFQFMPQATGTTGWDETKAIVGEAISQADNVIDGAIARRYSLGYTLTTAPPLLKSLSIQIASYYAFRMMFSSDNQNYNGYLEQYQDALETLKDIRNGDLDLVDSVGSVISEREVGSSEYLSSNTENYTPVFEMDSATSWRIDSDLKDAISRDS